jgi:hypothetical protein
VAKEGGGVIWVGIFFAVVVAGFFVARFPVVDPFADMRAEHNYRGQIRKAQKRAKQGEVNGHA